MSKKYQNQDVLNVTRKELRHADRLGENVRNYDLPELKELDMFLKGMVTASDQATDLAKVLRNHVTDLQADLREAGMKIDDLDTIHALNFDLSVVLLDYQALLTNLRPSRKQRRFLKHIGVRAGQAWFVKWIKSMTNHRTES